MAFKQMTLIILLVVVTIKLQLTEAKRSQEDQCINYYQTGNNFDLNSLIGKWFIVYKWPKSQRTRNSCEVITFINELQRDVDNELRNCDSNETLDTKTAVRANYVNNFGKFTNVTYFGDGEVKSLMLSCDRVHAYIFTKVDDDYVLGINCSANGRGVLLSRITPSNAQLLSIVDNIEIMTGREGGSEC